MNITHDVLGANGYTQYPSVLHRDDPNHKGFYQKCVGDEFGKRYFINIDLWCHSYPQAGKWVIRVSGTAWDQWSNANGSFRIEFDIYGETTVEQVENFFAATWEKLECDYYEGSPAKD